MKRTFNIPFAYLTITLIIISLFLSGNCQAQDVSKAKNIIYLDIGIFFARGAAAIGAGINYERMLSDNTSIRGGINIGMLGAGESGDAFSSSGIGFPISINYMTNNKNKFEIGAGAGPYLGFNTNKLMILPALRLGYRYQEDEPGMIYRAGLEFPSNFYISIASIGYHFK